MAAAWAAYPLGEEARTTYGVSAARAAAATSTGSPDSTVGPSTPPAASRLVTKACRAPKARRAPSAAMTTVGACPWAEAYAALRSRSASKTSASRCGTSPSGDGGNTGAGLRSRAVPPVSGNMLTPVMGWARSASASARSALVSAMRSATVPAASATTIPPPCSSSWKAPQARWARSSVSDSTYQAPPAGSATAPTWDSAARTTEVLRASRREKRSGSPATVS